MRRLLVLIAGLLAAAAFTTAAIADSPHFIGSITCTKSITTGLTCSGKASGLGNSPLSAVLTASQVTANYQCVNHGGNVAPGQPLVQSGVSGPPQNIAPHNGAINFSPTIPPPPTPSSATECPSGKWSVQLLSLSYTGVSLTISGASGTLLFQDLGDF